MASHQIRIVIGDTFPSPEPPFRDKNGEKNQGNPAGTPLAL
jgi:hypothetical protein